MPLIPDRPMEEAPNTLRRTGSIAIRWALATLVALVSLQVGCSPDDSTSADAAQRAALLDVADVAPDQLDTMLVSEELIEGLRSDMGALAFAARNLELPDARTRRLFRPLDLEVNDLAAVPADPDPDPTLRSLGLVLRDWPLSEPMQATNADLKLWRPLFDEVDHFRWTKFKIKAGRFVETPDDDSRYFETRVNFSALARLRSGKLAWVRSTQMLRWRLVDGRDAEKPENWRIVSWKTKTANRIDATGPFFEDVLDVALQDPAELERARVSIHERFVSERLLAKRAGESFTPPHELFTDVANDAHPGVAVVDVNGDGFDDLYVMTRLGRNQLLRNRGDGTLEEVAAEYGLDVEGHSASAIFADFDNDGDPDLVLGRTGVRTAYYENQDGRFVDRSEESVAGTLPFFASSISATDYDGDGLLDVYISTYSAALATLDAYRRFYSEKEVDEIERLARAQESNFLDVVGPPNVLLHNEGGGRFSIVKDPGDLRSFRHTYQATWADFDDDGDPDVYLSNDFAPDEMIRNDGDGRFVEASEQLGITSFGLGMGSTWGDYDRDGRQDLYVSNMYSTAGSRITSQLDYVDDRYREMAQGNYLYRNGEDGFNRVSGAKPPAFTVQRTGWSWASHFVDVDNDGFLDLGVLNGFYTAPREVALSGDT